MHKLMYLKKQRLLLLLILMIVEIIFIMLLAGATFMRNRTWATDFSLYSDVILKNPLCARGHDNMGWAYYRLGRYDEAILEYITAMRVDIDGKMDTNTYWAFYNMAIELEDKGLLTQSVYCYDVVCKSAPPLFHTQKKIACERVAVLMNQLSIKNMIIRKKQGQR